MRVLDVELTKLASQWSKVGPVEVEIENWDKITNKKWKVPNFLSLLDKKSGEIGKTPLHGDRGRSKLKFGHVRMRAEVGQNFSRVNMCILRANSVLNKNHSKSIFILQTCDAPQNVAFFMLVVNMDKLDPLGLLPSQNCIIPLKMTIGPSLYTNLKHCAVSKRESLISYSEHAQCLGPIYE